MNLNNKFFWWLQRESLLVRCYFFFNRPCLSYISLGTFTLVPDFRISAALLCYFFTHLDHLKGWSFKVPPQPTVRYHQQLLINSFMKRYCRTSNSAICTLRTPELRRSIQKRLTTGLSRVCPAGFQLPMNPGIKQRFQCDVSSPYL